MDSNCVNNCLGHALRAKCWHSFRARACQKRQAGKTWESHCAQLIPGCTEARLLGPQGWKEDLEGSWLAWKCTYVVAATLLGVVLHLARNKSHCQRQPAGKTNGGTPDTCIIKRVGERKGKSVRMERFYLTLVEGTGGEPVLWWRAREREHEDKTLMQVIRKPKF